MDAGTVFPVEGMNKERPASVSIPTSGDIGASISRPSLIDISNDDDVMEPSGGPQLGSPEEKGRFTKTTYGKYAKGSRESEREEGYEHRHGSRPSDVALSTVNPGSDVGQGIQISDFGRDPDRDSMRSDISVAGSSIPDREFSTTLSQSSMDTTIPREGVPTGASGFGAGTHYVDEMNDPGIGGIRGDFPSSVNPPFLPAGLATGVDPARRTHSGIPLGATDMFEPRPDVTPMPDEDPFETSAAYLDQEKFPDFGGPGANLWRNLEMARDLSLASQNNASIQGDYQSQAVYKDIPIHDGDAASALPPETVESLITPLLQSLNEAGAPRAHIRHMESVTYSADDVPGIGHVEGTIRRVTTVDQAPNQPNSVQSRFLKPGEEEQYGPPKQDENTDIRRD